MLHLLTEENSDLKNKTFPIPKGVRKLLQQTLNSYTGDKTIDGYKRLNNLLSMNSISYHEMKRIKNFFDHYNGTDKSAEFILNGGEPMKNWVNNTLGLATKVIHDFKKRKKDAGIQNAFIKNHEKNRQTKKKNKPTITKFNVSNQNMLDNNIMHYNENILRESIDLEEYQIDYGPMYVLDKFLHSNKGETQSWGVLINPSMYQKALSEFTTYGKLTSFPTKYIYQWMGIIFRNTITLESNTALAGHSSWFPDEDVQEFLEEYLGDKFYKYDINSDEVFIKIDENEFINLCSNKSIYVNESYGIHKDGQYDLFMNQEETDMYDKKMDYIKKNEKFVKYKEMADQYNKKSINRYTVQTDEINVNVKEGIIYRIKSIFSFLDDIGLYDWMIMPDGSEAWSDFGLSPIYEILEKYNDNLSPEEILVLINKVLDVYHQRGDLSSIFIQGGKTSLSKITNGNIYETKVKKTILITEQQSKMLKEAMDDTFSLEELSQLPSYNARFKYCTQHLGKHIGKGSSRATFQIDDEKVLKLAWNEKGVAQNDEEERAYGDDIFPQVFDSDPNGYWLVSEFVLPAKKQDFKYCFNMSFETFCSFIISCAKYRYNKKYFWQTMTEDEYINIVETNEDLAAFDEYIGNYGATPVGDMTRLCNYGLTKRNGEPHIVLLDSGLTEDVWNNFYKKRW